MTFTVSTLLSFVTTIALVCAQNQISLALSNVEWTLSNNALGISVPGYVPSQVHLDLYSAQVIGDPYYGNNDRNLKWIAESNWTYTSAPITGLSKSTKIATYLVFEGLDTFASITVCNKSIGSANNQFRQWIYDISSIYSACNPEHATISVEFTSPTIMAAYLATQPSEECRLCVIGTSFEIPNREYIRKEQSDFGWDWAPSFAPSGIWQPAYMVQFPVDKGIYVTNSMVDIYRRGQLNNVLPDQSQPWVINTTVDYVGELPSNASIKITLVDSVKRTFLSGFLTNYSSDWNGTAGFISGSMLVMDEPKLWWPVGYGDQNLYNMSIEINSQRNVLATVEKRVGFRTIVLNQEVISMEQLAQGIAPGANWNFQINDHELYCKGSNFVPPDAFWPRVTQERMRYLLESVIDGNQNMLRVWASGAYLPDFVYDMADEMGVLLWSEIQFSDSFYPTTPYFIANVVAEVTYQVRRINHHPSLAVWVGSNELELFLAYIAESPVTSQYLDPARRSYEYLLLDVVLHVVYDNTRSISYSPSSTSNGYLSLNHSSPTLLIERYLNGTPGAIYGNRRFAVEFGFVSMPSLQSWRTVLPTNMLYFNSSVIVDRNHHTVQDNDSPFTLPKNFANASLYGIGQMSIASEAYYPYRNKRDPIANFSSQILTSQIFHADFMKSQIQFYRVGSGLPQRNLGSLYWQLNDIWQTVSFGGLEYDGRWKVLHYTAKDVYQPVVIVPIFNSTTGIASIYVVSDLWSNVEGTASLVWYDFEGKILNASSTSVKVGVINATKVFEFKRNELAYSLDDAIAILQVEVEGEAPNSSNKYKQIYTHTNWYTPVPLSEAKLVDPKLILTYNKTTEKFTVESKAVAVWTWLDYPAGVVGNFEDNGFVLLPGHKKEVGFKVKNDTTEGRWRETVSVVSIWNNTLA